MNSKHSNHLNTDFKATTLAAEFIEQASVNADEIIILPLGARKRAYAKEIESLTSYQSVYRNREMLAIHINREGLYDMLPEGLFHQPPASSVLITEEEMVKDIVIRREEEKQARSFFAPFEAELYHIRTIIELYENRLDKKSEYDDLVNIFLTEWREFNCFTNAQMLILIHVLPVIHEQRNNLKFVSDVLGIMFKVDFDMQYVTSEEKESTNNSSPLTTRLGENTLGVNFIAGQADELNEKLVITIGPLTAKQLLEFLPGTRSSQGLEVILSYFIPLQTPVTTKFIADPEHQKLLLGFAEENSCLGFTTYLGN